MRVDTQQRRLAAELLRGFIEGRITNDALDNGWPSGHRDPALRQIFSSVWACYDDLHRHFFDGSPETRALLERCAEFLESDEPYAWPEPNRLLILLSTPLALLTFGLSNRVLWRKYRFPAYWPFHSEAAREHHRRPAHR